RERVLFESRQIGTDPVDGAWSAWASQVRQRSRLEQRLEAAVASRPQGVQAPERGLRGAKMGARAGIAAGAGHELNNPLAVILGRAQLLLVRSEDSEASRSLRTIIGQVQKAHRILRDLMYVARPPAPRPRTCDPDALLRSALVDLRDEAE